MNLLAAHGHLVEKGLNDSCFDAAMEHLKGKDLFRKHGIFSQNTDRTVNLLVPAAVPPVNRNDFNFSVSHFFNFLDKYGYVFGHPKMNISEM